MYYIYIFIIIIVVVVEDTPPGPTSQVEVPSTSPANRTRKGTRTLTPETRDLLYCTDSESSESHEPEVFPVPSLGEYEMHC